MENFPLITTVRPFFGFGVTMKKTAIITGASSGIGAATAEQLLKYGWTVFACARRKEKMVSLESKGAITLELDVTQNESMRTMVETVIRH